VGEEVEGGRNGRAGELMGERDMQKRAWGEKQKWSRCRWGERRDEQVGSLR